jgi:hypothetical protein
MCLSAYFSVYLLMTLSHKKCINCQATPTVKAQQQRIQNRKKNIGSSFVCREKCVIFEIKSFSAMTYFFFCFKKNVYVT